MITLKNDWKSNRTFQNRKMVQASTLRPNKHKRGRLRYLRGDYYQAEAKAGNTQYFRLDGTQKVEDVSKALDKILA